MDHVYIGKGLFITPCSGLGRDSNDDARRYLIYARLAPMLSHTTATPRMCIGNVYCDWGIVYSDWDSMPAAAASHYQFSWYVDTTDTATRIATTTGSRLMDRSGDIVACDVVCKI